MIITLFKMLFNWKYAEEHSGPFAEGPAAFMVINWLVLVPIATLIFYGMAWVLAFLFSLIF
jgi:hypothetical protein